jgi:hypothetical protein
MILLDVSPTRRLAPSFVMVLSLGLLIASASPADVQTVPLPATTWLLLFGLGRLPGSGAGGGSVDRPRAAPAITVLQQRRLYDRVLVLFGGARCRGQQS